MTFLLDTSVLIDAENKHGRTMGFLRELRSRYPLFPVTVPFMVYFEFYHGLRNKPQSLAARSLAFLEVLKIILPTQRTARLLSQLRHKYPAHGLSDMLIAAQVIEQDGVLVTSDKGFQNVSELRIILLDPKSLFGADKGMKPFRRDHCERSL